MIRIRLLRVLAAAALLAGGCSGSLPSPKRPALVPAEVAQRAMAQYDADHDGKIDAQELKKCPALLDAMERMDANHDGALVEEEIAGRVKKWLAAATGTVAILVPVTVFLDDQPLPGATVTFEPEAFMGPAYTASSGVTDKAGNCAPAGDDPTYRGVHPGLYRVTISKKVNGVEVLPARYNTATELGKEVANDLPRANRQFIFRLTSQ
jgi:hypothetical protein